MRLTPEFIARFQLAAKIPPWDLDRMLQEVKHEALEFAQLLVRDEWLDREVAGGIMGSINGCTYVNLSHTLFQKELLEKMPRELAEKVQAIPIYRLGKAVTVAMSHPELPDQVSMLEQVLMLPVSPVFSFPDELSQAIKVSYESSAGIDSLVKQLHYDLLKTLDMDALVAGKENKARLQAVVDSSEIVNLADALLLLAIKENASDVHIETKKHSVAVRFRIDGVLHDRISLPMDVSIPLLARYKIMAKLDSLEHRRPQDGRMSIELPAQTVDVRASIVPTLHGEKLVMRLIGARFTMDMLSLDKMSISPEILQPLKKVLANPAGMLLVSGPTGSGKTTTLYAALNYVNRPEVNIITIEDPVEYENHKINQIMVNTKIGRTFDTILRSVLRQDPDVILVGEIRDLETARIVAQAALTGHLVLTTVHTGSAIQALTRLVEMGVERFIVAPSIIGVVGQRLVRRICEYCKTPYRPDEQSLREVFYWDGAIDIPTLYRGAGCERCGGSGYRGRVAIHEFLNVDSLVRDYIIQGREYEEIRKLARNRGFKDLRYDGFRKALRGITTLEEVCRVTNEVAD